MDAQCLVCLHVVGSCATRAEATASAAEGDLKRRSALRSERGCLFEQSPELSKRPRRGNLGSGCKLAIFDSNQEIYAMARPRYHAISQRTLDEIVQ